jgi:hypothetical protein
MFFFDTEEEEAMPSISAKPIQPNFYIFKAGVSPFKGRLLVLSANIRPAEKVCQG